MECLIGTKKVRLNPYNMKFSPSLGKGSKASVYLIDGDAYKIYNPFCKKESINKESVKLFSSIPVKRFLFPKESILDKKRSFIGYISPAVIDLGVNHFLDFEKDLFLKEIAYLYEDAITLGDKKILINDMSIENTSFNNGIYVNDVGEFKTEEQTNLDVNQTISYNTDAVNEYIINQLIGYPIVRIYKGNLRKIRQECIGSLSNGVGLISYFEDDIGEEKVGDYVKRKIR